MARSELRGWLADAAAACAIGSFVLALYAAFILPGGTLYGYAAFAVGLLALAAAIMFFRRSRAEGSPAKVGVESIGGEGETISDVTISPEFDYAVRTVGGKRTKITKIRAGTERADDLRSGRDRG